MAATMMHPSMPVEFSAGNDVDSQFSDTSRFLLAVTTDPKQMSANQPIEECGTPPSVVRDFLESHNTRTEYQTHPRVEQVFETIESPTADVKSPSGGINPIAEAVASQFKEEASQAYSLNRHEDENKVLHQEKSSIFDKDDVKTRLSERFEYEMESPREVASIQQRSVYDVPKPISPLRSRYEGSPIVSNHSPKQTTSLLMQAMSKDPRMADIMPQKLIQPVSERSNKRKKKKRISDEQKALIRRQRERQIRFVLLCDYDALKARMKKKNKELWSKMPHYGEESDVVDIELTLRRYTTQEASAEKLAFMYLVIRCIVIAAAAGNLMSGGKLGVNQYSTMVEARLRTGEWDAMLLKIYLRWFRHASPPPLITVGGLMIGLLIYDIANTKSGGRLANAIEKGQSAIGALKQSDTKQDGNQQNGGIFGALGGLMQAATNAFSKNSETKNTEAVTSSPSKILPESSNPTARSGLRAPPTI